MRRGELETVAGEERAKGSTWQLGEENVECHEFLVTASLWHAINKRNTISKLVCAAFSNLIGLMDQFIPYSLVIYCNNGLMSMLCNQHWLYL